MIQLAGFVQSARRELPQALYARWAAVFFSLGVLTLLVSISVSQAALAASGIAYGLHLWRARPEVSLLPITLPLALFCVGTVLAVVAATNPAVGWLAVRKLVLFLILLLAANLVTRGKHLLFLLHGLFAVSALAAVVGTVQFVLQYRAVRALYPDRVYASMTSDRITGFMGHWMNFSGQQMLVFVVLLACLLLAPRALEARWRATGPLGAVALGLVALSLVLGFTRGVWLGCAAATLYLVARWRPRLLWALPVIASIGYFLAPGMVRQRVRVLANPRSDPALSIRFEMWDVGFEMMKRHPWLGVGPNNIEQQYVLYLPPGKSPEPGYHAHLHSNVIHLGAERGVPVLVAWVWMMGALAWHSWRLRRRLREFRWTADAALAAWLAFVVEGCFEFNFGTSPVLMLFLVVMAIPFAAERIELAAAKAAAAPA